MKRVISLLICVITLLTMTAGMTVYADSSTAPVKELSLEDAYILLEKNNLDIKFMDKKIEFAQKKYENAVEKSRDAVFMQSGNTSVNFQYRKEEKLDWKIKKLEIEDLENQRENLVKTLKADIKQKYINITFLNNEIELLNEELKNLDKQLEEIQVRIELGQAKETDRKLVYSQKLTMSNQLLELNKQIDTLLLDLKKELGINVATKLELKEFTLPYMTVDTENLEKDIEAKANNSFAVYKLKKQLEYKQFEKQLFTEYTYKTVSIEIDNYNMEIMELENKIEQQVLDSMVEYWNDYYNIMIQKENITLEQLNLEIEKINYDSTMARAKLGMVDAAAESNARIAYKRQENNLKRAMYNYISAVEQFNDKLSIE